MQLGFRRLVPFLLGASALGILVIGAGAAGPSEKDDGCRSKRVVMFASDGMRPDLMEKYAKAGAMPTYKELMKDGRHRRQRDGARPSRRTPASAGTRWPPARTRPSTARRTTRTSAAGTRSPNRTSFSARRHDAGGHDRQRGRARGQEGRADRLGRRRRGGHRRARPSTSRTSSRTAACSSARRNAAEQAGSAFFGVDLPGRRRVDRPRAGPSVPAGDPAATPKETTWTIDSTFAAQNPNRTYNVYFYDSVTGGGVELRPRDRQPGRQDRRGAVDRPQGRRLPARSS